MDQFADLHTHTTASDGTFTPTELLSAAHSVGLKYLAVTDHDTLSGLPEAMRIAKEKDIRLIPGVELSVEGKPGKCHLLGLAFDPDHEELNRVLCELSQSRRERNERIANRLQNLGISVSMAEVTRIAPTGANIGRPHFALALVEKGYVRDVKEAFDRYLADDAAAYVTKDTLSPEAAIHLIHRAGGLCFIAHPGLLKLAEHETYETRFRALRDLGMDGIEAYYSAYSPALTEQLLRLSERLGLMVTGGSDFHGANKENVPLGIVRDGARLPASLLPMSLLDHS
jgi:predicted metal-dependent phosphoesterase TrpH